MKTGIILDTNIFFTKNFSDYTQVKFLKKIEEIINAIKINNLENKVNILFPQIVVDELIEQQSKSYYEQIDQISNKRFPNMNIEKIEHYDAYLKEIFKDGINSITCNTSINFKILSYPEPNTLDKIINRALKKLPPFEGTEKESDKGFKDVVLWESIIKYKKSHAHESIIFYTKDKVFSNPLIAEEYYALFEEKIKILKEQSGKVDPLIQLIGEELNSTIVQTDKSKLYNKFTDIIYDSNFDLLYKDSIYYSNIYDKDFRFDALKILSVNYFDSPRNIMVDLLHEVEYFVVEMEIELTYIEDLHGSSTSNTLSIKDFYEYEIYYYKDSEEFVVIGFDEPFENFATQYEELELKKRNSILKDLPTIT